MNILLIAIVVIVIIAAVWWMKQKKSADVSTASVATSVKSSTPIVAPMPSGQMSTIRYS